MCKKLVTKSMSMFLRFAIDLKYLKTDVFLLADVLEKFTNSSLKNYGLNPSHYPNAPALNWGAMLYMTKVELELTSDTHIYLLFETDLKGGTSCFSQRYSKINNEYLKSYDPKQESKHIIYSDANNAHGYAMFKILPTGKFKWMDSKEFETINIAVIVWKIIF